MSTGSVPCQRAAKARRHGTEDRADAMHDDDLRQLASGCNLQGRAERNGTASCPVERGRKHRA